MRQNCLKSFLLWVVEKLKKKKKVKKLFKVEIPKSALLAVPEPERIFLVQCGSLLNDITTFQKLMLFATNDVSSNTTVRTSQNCQALLFARMLAGKLSEGWQMLQKDYFGTQLSKNYDGKLSDQEKSCLKNLKDYFSSENIIFFIRNKFAFHYSSDDFKQIVDQAPNKEVFEVFIAEEHGNCLYGISHVLVNFAILQKTGMTNIPDAFKKVLSEINQVARWFADFLGGCLLIIVRENVGFQKNDVEIPDPPCLSDVQLPYFIQAD